MIANRISTLTTAIHAHPFLIFSLQQHMYRGVLHSASLWFSLSVHQQLEVKLAVLYNCVVRMCVGLTGFIIPGEMVLNNYL